MPSKKSTSKLGLFRKKKKKEESPVKEKENKRHLTAEGFKRRRQKEKS